jgi:hypothetical protein
MLQYLGARREGVGEVEAGESTAKEKQEKREAD